jgi:hypothetical protein
MQHANNASLPPCLGDTLAVGLDTALIRNAEMLHASVGQEAVMMSVAAGRYYGVNAVGARIWELLETPKTVAELCTQICEEFEVDFPTCELALLKFANVLVDNDVVRAAAA